MKHENRYVDCKSNTKAIVREAYGNCALVFRCNSKNVTGIYYGNIAELIDPALKKCAFMRTEVSLDFLNNDGRFCVMEYGT
jgi:hypothetical protein